MFTKEEKQWLYQILDQITVQGEEQKQIVVDLMRKLRQMLDKPIETEEVE